MDANKLGKKVKLPRTELDLPQTEFPHKITAQQKSISRYETGASLPSIETSVKIAKFSKNQLVILWMSKEDVSLIFAKMTITKITI